jgi:hypothetical protein
MEETLVFLNGFFKGIDNLVESSLEVSQAFPGHTTVRPDCNPAEKPCSRNLFSPVPELALEQGLEKRRIDIPAEMADDITFRRDIIKSGEIGHFCCECKISKVHFVNKREFRIPEDLSDGIQGIDCAAGIITGCPGPPFKTLIESQPAEQGKKVIITGETMMIIPLDPVAIHII